MDFEGGNADDAFKGREPDEAVVTKQVEASRHHGAFLEGGEGVGETDADLEVYGRRTALRL
jgi:hypothetical protein